MKSKTIWLIWVVLSLSIGGYFLYTLLAGEDKTEFLIGETTYGHYQIELACATCHTDPFGGKEVLQDACLNCHAEELEEAHDSHPKKKFTDPRDAHRLEVVDARYCISCHTEHHKDRTHPMGVTLPEDYCYHCHQDVVKDRESHKDLPFDSCASAGCHNFHDNRALYEEFLVKNADQPWLHEIARISAANAASNIAIENSFHPFEEKMKAYPEETAQWHESSHADAGVTCGGCHSTEAQPQVWIEKPGIEQCANCHNKEVKGFTSGKHGMRLAAGVSGYKSPISPAESKLMFHHESLNVQQGCNSCHSAHNYDVKSAAVESCLGCHADQHSAAFLSSPHGKLWTDFITGEREDIASTVTCATCHMPKTTVAENGKPLIYIQHNQNHNLRPNEKMIRPVCMNCHGLGFSIDALADPELIKNNFNGKPGTHIESIEWSLKRVK